MPVNSPKTITLYRIGPISRLEPWSNEVRDAEPVTVSLRGGAWVQTDAEGSVYFFNHERSMGLGLSTAMMLGLCRPVDPEQALAELEAQRREHRAVLRERATTTMERLSAAVKAAAAVRSPLASYVHRATPEETLEALAEYFEGIASDRAKAV